MEISGNHLVPDLENMRDDGTFLQIQIQPMQHVQHSKNEQVQCCAKLTAPETTFLAVSL